MKTLLLLLTVAVGLFGAQPDADLTAVMDSLRQAMIARDGAALDRMLHPDLMYTHSAGQFETKADMIKSITAGKSPITKIEYSDMTTRVFGNTALVKGRTDLWHGPTLVPMSVLYVWQRDAGKWRLVARQATLLPKT